MKKVKVFLAMGLILFIAVQQAKSQGLVATLKEKLTLGLKVEGNGSSFLIKDNADLKSKIGAGGSMGPVIRFNISDHFAIQEDILFTYKTSDIELNGVKDKFQSFGTEVPIYFMGQWKNASGGRFYVGAGPYVGYAFSGKYKDSDINVFKKYDGEKAEMKRLSNGAAATIGYELRSGLQINASYKYGFNALDRDKNLYKIAPQSFSIGLGYSF